VVDDVMSRVPLTVKPDDSVVDLARRMGRDKPKVYPVVDSGKLVGLITRGDVLKALRREVLACSTEGRRR
jgi:CBS domain-containing protein